MKAELLLGFLATIGLTQIWLRSSLFNTPRLWLSKRAGKISELAECAQCVGFWASLVVALYLGLPWLVFSLGGSIINLVAHWSIELLDIKLAMENKKYEQLHRKN